MMTLILGLMLAQSALQVSAMPPPLMVQRAEHQALALEIAKLLNSEALMRLQAKKLFTQTYPNTFAATPEIAALEKEHPGAIAAITDALKRVSMENVTASLPDLWARLTPLYARTFTTTELRKLLDFYRSPTGARLINAVARDTDYSSMVQKAINDATTTGRPEASGVTSEGLRASQAGAIRGAVGNASKNDRAVLLEFRRSGLMPKLSSLSREIAATGAAWANERSSADKVDAAVTRAIEKHVGREISE